MVTWGIHNEHPELNLLANAMVTVGWDEIGDLSVVGHDRQALKAALAAALPDAKPGAFPVWAGVLHRFVEEMQPGDVVIWPNRQDSTLNFGRVTGRYRHESTAEVQRNRRSVEWIKTAVPRVHFSQSALYEVGSAVTLFKVKNHESEFLNFLKGSPTSRAVPVGQASVDSDEAATASAEEAPNADRIETHSRDFVIKELHGKVDGYKFEYFVAHLLTCMGYRTQVTPASGDGGFDIIAHRDPLGLEPPIIKVQCKRTITAIGAPEVQKLTGTLAHGGGELGLFVTLGGYTTEAKNFGRNRQDLRLVSGPDLVDMIFENYSAFLPEWKRLLPLRQVYVVDQAPQRG